MTEGVKELGPRLKSGLSLFCQVFVWEIDFFAVFEGFKFHKTTYKLARFGVPRALSFLNLKPAPIELFAGLAL